MFYPNTQNPQKGMADNMNLTTDKTDKTDKKAVEYERKQNFRTVEA